MFFVLQLHVRKIVVARDKLRPLNEREMGQRNAVLHEEAAGVRVVVFAPLRRFRRAFLCGARFLPGSVSHHHASTVLPQSPAPRTSAPQGARGSAPGGPPDTEVVFSQCRNNRFKRLEESLNSNFDINAENEEGNTLLLVACQNANRRMAELLVHRRAAINHQDAHGNTALHFAMAFDTSGELGEFLIEKGADDTMENIYGLTPYDGLTIDDGAAAL